MVEKKKAVAIDAPTETVKKSVKKVVKKTSEKKEIVKKETVKKDADKKNEPKLTQGQKLLAAMTAQKAAKQALLKGVAKTHVTFDDEGNESTETVVQKHKVEPRPAVKKPEKRKIVKEEEEKEDTKKQAKKPKKEKKKKIKVDSEEKKELKQEEVLTYVKTFVQDKESWKFKKMLQIWLLQNLYKIPEAEFDNVLLYIQDLQGSARENTKKEAENKIPVKKEIKNTLTGYSNVSNNFDDFDAEKLLAQATMAPPPPQEEEQGEESNEVKRARQILKVLS